MAVQLRPAPSPQQSAADSLDAIRVLEPSGAFGDTLLLVPSGGLLQGGEIHYFTPEPMWALTDSLTVLYGVNSEFRIGYYDRDGSLTRIVSKAFVPAPITERDTRAIFGFLDRAWLDAGVPPSRLPENRSRIRFAEFFPAFSVFGKGDAVLVEAVRELVGNVTPRHALVALAVCVLCSGSWQWPYLGYCVRKFIFQST